MNNHRMLPTLGLLAFVALAAPAAHTQTNAPPSSRAVSSSDPDYEAKRAKALKNLKSKAVYDKDRDGKIDDEERKKLAEDAMKVVRNRFEKAGSDQDSYRRQMDTNGDGRMDDAECEAAAAKYEKDLMDSWASFERQFPDLVP